MAITITETWESSTHRVGWYGTWVRSNTVSPQAGSWCITSPDIGDNGQASLFVPIPEGATSCSFYYYVSSEQNFDYLRVYLDGEEIVEASGSVSWTSSGSVSVTGAQLLEFRYTKDSSDSVGSDLAAIDQLAFTLPDGQYNRVAAFYVSDFSFPTHTIGFTAPQAGSRLIAEVSSAVAISSVSSGWTLDAGDSTRAFYSKIATGAETSFQFITSSATLNACAVIHERTDCPQFIAADDASGTSITSLTATITVPSNATGKVFGILRAPVAIDDVTYDQDLRLIGGPNPSKPTSFLMANPPEGGSQNFTASNLTSNASASVWWVALYGDGDTEITPGRVLATVSVPTPGRSAGSGVSPTATGVGVAVPAPAISASATIFLEPVALAIALPAPSVSSGTIEAVVLDTVTVSATVPDPILGTSSILPLETVPVGTKVPSPDISAQFNLVLPLDVVTVSAYPVQPLVSAPILPGDLMTGDYQIEYAEEILFGAWPYIILTDTVEGWDDLVELDSGNALKPREHGASPGSKFGQQRYVSATVLIADQTDDFMARVKALRRATRAPRGAAEPDLVIRTRGETLLARGSIAARVLPPNQFHAGFAAVALRWECSDPRRYSLQQYSQTLAVNVAETVTNSGDEDSLPRIRITGPAEYPSVTNQTLGLTLAFAIQLENGERLDVDCSTGTVRIGNQNYESALADLSVPVKMFTLAPGDNEVLYETESAGLGGIEILYRDAYM